MIIKSTLFVLIGLSLSYPVFAQSRSPRIELRSGPITLESNERSTRTPSVFGDASSNAAAPLFDEYLEAIAHKERVIVQFDQLPGVAEREALRQQGIVLGDYLGNGSYYATQSGQPTVPTVFSDIATSGDVRMESVDSITNRFSTFKIDESAQALLAEITNEREILLEIKIYSDVDPEQVEAEMRRTGFRVLSSSETSHSLTLIAKRNEVELLRQLREVELISIAAPRPRSNNDGIRRRLGTESFEMNGLSGKGVRVGIFDGGVVSPDHPGFENRLIVGESPFTVNVHSTHVAGTLAGDGKSKSDDLMVAETGSTNMSSHSVLPQTASEEGGNGISGSVVSDTMRYRGLATEAHLVSYNFFNKPHDKHVKAINQHNIQLANNSWGYSPSFLCFTFGDYTSEAWAYDNIVTGKKARAIPVIFAMGNDRNDGHVCGMQCGCSVFDGAPNFQNYGTVPPPVTAKNVISVGAINADDDTMTTFSNFGPTDDGRLKPDVVAPGCKKSGDRSIKSAIPPESYGNIPGNLCGTSFAAPAVSGVIANLIEHLEKGTHSADLIGNNVALPSTFKSLLVHGAIDLAKAGPDYQSGYGLVDAQATLDLLAGEKKVIEGTLKDTSSVFRHEIEVPSGSNRLRATLVWDDQPGAVGKQKALVNDLDLLLVSPTFESFHPWTLSSTQPDSVAVPGKDRLNVVEVVDVAMPITGNWVAVVQAEELPLPQQTFSLIVSAD